MTDVQKKILEIYKEIKKICDIHNIKFFAIGGTCIGAVRHNGFIPWDDDMDIAIPIEEYEHFLQIAKEELPENLQIYSCDDVRHYRYIFAKVIDKNTTFIERAEYAYNDAYKGVYVDIMPMSGVPSSKCGRTLFCKTLNLLYSFNFCCRFPKEQHSLKGGAAVSILKFFPYDLFSRCQLKVIKKYPFADSEYVGYVWSKSLSRLIFKKKFFLETIDVKFEDVEIKCPKGYDEYLTQQFGDYMKLPPAEKQVGHHNGVVDLENTYLKYKNNCDLIDEKIRKG